MGIMSIQKYYVCTKFHGQYDLCVRLVLLKIYKVAWFLCAMDSNGIILVCRIVVVYIRSFRFIVACFQLNYGELDS
jgi:hypothetical protein